MTTPFTSRVRAAGRTRIQAQQATAVKPRSNASKPTRANIVAAQQAATWADDSILDRTSWAVAESRQRIASSRAYLTRGQNPTEPGSIANDANPSSPNG